MADLQCPAENETTSFRGQNREILRDFGEIFLSFFLTVLRLVERRSGADAAMQPDATASAPSSHVLCQ